MPLFRDPLVAEVLRQLGERAADPTGVAVPDPLRDVDAHARDRIRVKRAVGGNLARSEPAHEVHVWARTPGNYYHGDAGTLTASQSTFSFQHGVPHLENVGDSDWPFPSVIPLGDLAENESWIGATWKVPGRPDGRFLIHNRVDGTRFVRRDDDAQ